MENVYIVYSSVRLFVLCCVVLQQNTINSSIDYSCLLVWLNGSLISLIELRTG